MVDDDDFSLDEAFSEKAQLDTEELGGSPGEDKVELDLEDAPFLEEEEEEPEQEEAPASSDPVLLDEPKGEKRSIKDLLKNRKVLFALVGAVVLAIGVIVAIFLMGGDSAPPPPPEPEKKVVEKQVEEPVEEPEPYVFTVTWEPFWVEKVDADGNIRFLVCKFAATTENERLSWEVGTKKVVLRDAIFYYLRNKSLLFLADKGNVEVLKSDLLAVINQYLDNGQLEELLIENYLVK